MGDQDERFYQHLQYNIVSHAYYELSEVSSSYVAMHWHNALEIISILKGELTVETEQQKMNLRQGDCVLIGANVLHSTISLTGNTAILFQIPMSDLDLFIPDISTRQFFWDPFTSDPEERKNIEIIRTLLLCIKENEEEKPYGYLFRSASLLLEILFQLCRNFSHSFSRADLGRSLKNQRRIAQVISYTEEHYRESISLEEVADLLHLQVNYFCRFFKNTTGCTYMQYLNDYRISRIHRDLISTDIPLSDLLEIHGFTNEKLFRSLFRQRFHTTPGALRRAHHDKKPGS